MRPQVIQLVPARYVTIKLAAQLTGLTDKAIRRKIESGKWAEGLHYRRSPDGGIFIDMRGYESWVTGPSAGPRRTGPI